MDSKKKYSKTTGCMLIFFIIAGNYCETTTTKYFCELLGITRFVFYTYIAEINIFLEEYYHLTNDYTRKVTIEYDKFLKKYCLVELN